MAKFVNSHGVTCSVSDREAQTLTGDWQPVADVAGEGSAPPEPARVEPAGARDDAPAGNASRADWAAYAESLGIEPGDLTRDELRDAVANH